MSLYHYNDDSSTSLFFVLEYVICEVNTLIGRERIGLTTNVLNT